MAGEGSAVQVEGLAQLRRDVKAMDREVSKELTKALKSASEAVLPAARASAPRRSGRLAASLTANAAGNKASIRSRVVYANAVHWGTGRRPNQQGPHNIRPSKFVVRAVDVNQDRIVDVLGDHMEQLADRHGWR